MAVKLTVAWWWRCRWRWHLRGQLRGPCAGVGTLHGCASHAAGVGTLHGCASHAAVVRFVVHWEGDFFGNKFENMAASCFPPQHELAASPPVAPRRRRWRPR
eukprot:366258-Chlamydomonas_euryale.AAC.14